MEDFFKFKKMITPVIIQIVFIIGTILLIVFGISMINEGSNMRRGGESVVLTGWMLILLGPVILRIYCEVLIVVFAINDTLTDVKNILKGKKNNENKSLLDDDAPFE